MTSTALGPGAAGNRSTVRLAIHEGRKRQVRRMLRAVGHPVRRLHRPAFAGLQLDLATPGAWRPLEPAEVAGLASQVGLVRGG
jgi:23S rRNA pseudouridine2605 synthase